MLVKDLREVSTVLQELQFYTIKDGKLNKRYAHTVGGRVTIYTCLFTELSNEEMDKEVDRLFSWNDVMCIITKER